MQETPAEVLTIIVAVIFILVAISVFLLVMLIYFNNRKLRSIKERERMKAQFQRTLLETQLEVQEQTMREISQEIHDNIGQVLSLVNLNLKTLSTFDEDKIHKTSDLVHKAINDLRNLSKSLNPENISKQGIIQVLRNELDQLEGSGKFSTSLDVQDEMELPAGKLIILYRMIQEVISNIIRHSGASEISVKIDRNMLVIADNGKGFNNGTPSNGLGLQNLKQRAAAIGAELNIETAPHKGTIVIFNIHESGAEIRSTGR
ncbi:MAG: sensor histidine kinase [Chitinophagaceae bacterium]|jgi:signal transduction histidine kinase|nr:sensor histidine kinase [Chitinophagaceae bacterium]